MRTVLIIEALPQVITTCCECAFKTIGSFASQDHMEGFQRDTGRRTARLRLPSANVNPWDTARSWTKLLLKQAPILT